jgi:hypothetical protein
VPDTARLMQLARLRLDQGTLPQLAVDTTLGGISAGADCRLCDEPIVAGSMEIEVLWDENAVRRRMTLHPPCHSAWVKVASTPESVAR